MLQAKLLFIHRLAENIADFCFNLSLTQPSLFHVKFAIPRVPHLAKLDRGFKNSIYTRHRITKMIQVNLVSNHRLIMDAF